ncbi:uncharacterized protein LDX57_002331 [Aspergillus melleus]|uniref:uncharacterized protein n=1 Tax=Aspergillus melleus TaxID=138277 RepID=UPI001E8E09FB|nr:uncharacterized protein LDX57_002331 [Aspergillus melleus]KAH8424584.1 hypothetical protein LDX57_002331 [Aspergillus melleus]
MDTPEGSSPLAELVSRMGWHHVYIAGTAVLVVALVAVVLFLSSRRGKIDYNSGIFPYVKFVYANFLKPHQESGEGQQGALESFYKTQV